MANTIVPFQFSKLLGNDVRISHVPNSTDWRVMGDNANHLNGRGAQLMPATFLDATHDILTASLETQYEIAIFPRPQALERSWVIGTKGAFLSTTFVTASGHLSTAASGSVHLGANLESLFEIRESVFDTSASDGVSIVSLTASNNFSGWITQLSIWETPRAFLSLTRSLDSPVHSEGFTVRTPIWADSSVSISDVQNVRGVVLATSSAIGNSRKAGLWYYVSPVRFGGVLNATGSGVLQASKTRAYFSDASASIQTRRVSVDETMAAVDIYVLVSVEDKSDTLKISFETESGNSTTISCSPSIAGSAEWFSGQLQVRTDGTDSSGSATPSAGTDRFNFSWITSLDSGSIYSVCIGEKHRDF